LGSHTPHVAEESEAKHTTREIWGATLSTFFFKFVFALTFIVPVLLLKLPTAIIASVIWGLLILGFFSFNLAREPKKKALESYNRTYNHNISSFMYSTPSW